MIAVFEEDMYETAGDTTMDDSFNDGRTEEEYSQEL